MSESRNEPGAPAPGAPSPGGARPGLLDLMLRPFAHVNAGEGLGAVLLTLNILFLLLAYYLLKTVREPLILTGGGAEVKSYASAGQAVLLVGLIQAYGSLAKRVPRLRLITITSLFFAACLLVFFVLGVMKVPYLGVAFYLWVGCFNMMVVSQFWSFANDVYTPEQGKRLFAIVGVGSSVGAVLGAKVAKWLIVPLGPYVMMLVAFLVLLLCLALTHASARTERRDNGPKVEDVPVAKRSAFTVLIGDRYLLLIAALAVLLNWVNSNGEYILDRVLVDAADTAIARGETTLTAVKFIGAFKADFFFYVNVVGVVLQLGVVSRLVKYFGVRVALFVLPCVALASYSCVLLVPLLSVVRIGKTAENATDYSIQNTVKQMLFLPTSSEVKFTAKPAIDTILVRIGDLLSAGVVAIGAATGLGTKGFALVNLVLILAWLPLVFRVGAAHAKREQEISS
jgi:ATP:ADP antiporter, AAA family